MRGSMMRDHRERAGLTLPGLARAIGISEVELSAYECGTERPDSVSLQRFRAALDAGADSAVFSQRLLTVPAAAAALRAGLRARWPTADLLRLVRQMRADAVRITASDRSVFLAEPSTTGDPRWDAMLAGNAEELALRMGIEPPAWTRGHALPQFWFVGSMPALHAYAFAHTPFSLQVRGVMVDPADLESV